MAARACCVYTLSMMMMDVCSQSVNLEQLYMHYRITFVRAPRVDSVVNRLEYAAIEADA